MSRSRVALANLVLALPPLRSRSARRLLRDATRRLRRARRRRAEARGSDARSRPALHDMDRKLLAHAGAGGFFVEAGANDGFTQSNTYWLERFHGWRGVLVEAIPELYAACVDERPGAHVVNCALVPDGHAADTVTVRNAGLMSIVPGARGSAQADAEWVAQGTAIRWEEPYEVAVPARTLTSVLEEAGAPRPDLISLDVEGYEPEVLAGLDLERYGPRLLLLELRDAAARARAERMLAGRYAPLDELSPFDVLYRRT